MRWDSTWSFEELVNMLLVDPKEVSKVSPLVFMTASENEIEKANARYMCPSAEKFLQEYKKAAPEKQFLGLATNPSFAQRTELVSGALMTLTTNTKIW